MLKRHTKNKLQMIFVSLIIILLFGLIFSNYVQALIHEEFDTTTQQPGPYYTPTYGDEPIYCIEHGNWEIFKQGNIDWETALDIYENPDKYEISDSGHAGHQFDEIYKGKFTSPHYIPKGGGTLSPAMAYIISDSPVGQWSEEKQKAIWNLMGTGLDGGLVHGTTSQLGGSELDKPARDYAEFDELVREDGMQPEDLTDMNNVYVNVNQSSKEYIVGPFSLNYISGIYGDLAFGGISNMYVIGYDSNGNEVNSEIEISGIILDGETRVEPKYFTPDEELKTDEAEEQVYPEPEQEFYVVFQDPNGGGSTVSKIAIKVQFQYMLANGEYVVLEGAVIEIPGYKWKEHEKCKEQVPYYVNGTQFHRDCGKDMGTKVPNATKRLLQDAISADAEREIFEEEIILAEEMIDITMDLGGHVWEDKLGTKESMADGVSNTSGGIDIPLKNVKVTLYEADGTLAQLNSDSDEIMHSINPTLTDENGDYMFVGLDAMKKYYVTFEYNGQVYLPTEYLKTENQQYQSVDQMVNAGLYNTGQWEVTSKGTEPISSTFDNLPISRNDYDTRFQEIASYPANYRSSNSLGILAGGVGGVNAVFTQKDLMGYTLDGNGKYSQTGLQLVDGFAYDENGLQTDQYTEGLISSKIREYINNSGQFPDDEAMMVIYREIVGQAGSEDMEIETWRMLQFIEDCYIEAYTGSPFTQDVDLYPVYDCFIINEDKGSGYDQSSTTIDGVTYRPIYEGQFYVNLGLWRRQEFDASLRKDVYKAALKINDKTVIYNYEKRAEQAGEGTNSETGDDNNTYWDINVRMSDYDTYYNSGYNREIYQTDYEYNTPNGLGEGHIGDPLEIYVTYKITVRNQSMSIMSQIKEVVDYYDVDYTYKPNLSWVIYGTEENRTTSIDNDAYYNMMKQDQEVIDNESTSATSFIINSKEANATEGTSRYGNAKDLGDQYQNLYIRGLEDKKLATGESAYIYLTFQVNKDAQERVLLDDESSPKENLAEINGYSTFYRDGTELPNGVTKDSNNIAGLLDRDSNPGNLVASDLVGERYEQNFEDDTDRAPSIRVLIDEEAIRTVNGTVWEDERTKTVGDSEVSQDAIIGDGIRQEDEIGISGVTVQLVEKCTDGSEYIWQQTTTGENGRYEFVSYIPGDYVIRFYYGDTEATVIPSEGQPVSYNGQDFKSTTYQYSTEENKIDQETGFTDTLGRYQGYIYTDSQNISGTYNANEGTPTNDTFGYNIYKSDSAEYNYSDAKDIWSTSNRNNINIVGPVNSARLVQGREDVIDYSDNDITNHIAEVLASPYERPSYNGTEYTDDEMAALYQELMNETYMTAETGVIVVEFEYDRQQTDGLKGTANNSSNSSKDYIGDNQYNSNYTLNNVDLGLTERPKAQLEIDKSIANVKVTLANNSILFDINEAANNAIWQDHEEYSIDREKIDAEGNSVSDNDYYQEGDAIGMYEEYYGNGHRYQFRTVEDGVNDIVRMTDKGLIQLTMDEELMHGATIQITYTVKITNVGEVDYIDGTNKNFYYMGNTDGANVVTTTADQVVDYVQNNLQFEAVNEANSTDGWSVIAVDNLMGGDLVNNRFEEKLKQFNTIIQTENFNTSTLRPGEEVSKTLILSQLITPENTDDDLTYTNMVEVVKTSNENGRRMAYSVVGNQDPLLDDASELDSSVAERIVILPPFGSGEILTYCAIAAAVGVILIAGIVLIKKKVLKKTK